LHLILDLKKLINKGYISRLKHIRDRGKKVFNEKSNYSAFLFPLQLNFPLRYSAKAFTGYRFEERIGRAIS